ncbi:TspO and MBR related proteins [Geodermatophilus telluris]|uniref:TspO and MBR related proteins n=1 Tax=Geodermatophilus telluris TaxID=1190417 RepID=A0A1G6QAH7_9ACTN|nr:TspO/MBR family protein [Geodermatophilus telluris]SDC88914.1 TspO and MBR related proteins [Geodermatophilus telluris]
MRSTTLATSAAVAATALVGSAATDVTSPWYRRLDKPRWQPPGPVFGVVWTVLYVLLAAAGSRAVPRGGRGYVRAYAANLLLNAGWSWTFFRAHRPPLATVEAAVLASTADLTRRSARLDRVAGRLLLPYAGWTAFAVVLSADIARRNAG